MSTMILVNGFSINMFPDFVARTVRYIPMTIEYTAALIQEAIEFGNLVGAIGHVDTAAIVNGLLGTNITHSRATVKFGVATTLIVAQYTGPRLPEGTTTLPEGAEINFWFVEEDN